MPKNPELLSRADLRVRWGHCSLATIRRTERQFALRAETYVGLEPLYRLTDVEKVEQRREQHRRRTIARMSAERSLPRGADREEEAP